MIFKTKQSHQDKTTRYKIVPDFMISFFPVFLDSEVLDLCPCAQRIGAVPVALWPCKGPTWRKNWEMSGECRFEKYQCWICLQNSFWIRLDARSGYWQQWRRSLQWHRVPPQSLRFLEIGATADHVFLNMLIDFDTVYSFSRSGTHTHAARAAHWAVNGSTMTDYDQWPNSLI